MTQAMTAKWVERVREEAVVRKEYFDSVVVGLGLRVSRTGKKAWFVKSRTKGETSTWRLTLGAYPAMSLADAREAAREELLKAGRGENPASKRQEYKGSLTVEQLARAFIERYAKARKRSWLKDEQALARDVLPLWGNRKACDIKRRDVCALLDTKVAAGFPVQANRLLALVRKMFNWAVSQDLLETNPCLMIEAPSVEVSRERVLTIAELRKVWRAAREFGGVIEPMFHLRILTAQRGGEVSKMRWEHLDFEDGWWTIPASDAKNKASHRVPLSRPALALLCRLRERRTADDGGWVFCGRRKGQHFKHLGNPTKELREASGVEFVPHDLRRSAASHMTGMGIPRLVVSKLLNHAESGTTRIYDRSSYDNEKREALEAWAARVMARIATETQDDD